MTKKFLYTTIHKVAVHCLESKKDKEKQKNWTDDYYEDEWKLTPGARYVTLLPPTLSVSETCLQNTQVHP